MLGILFKVKVKAEKRQAFIDFINWDIQVAKEREPGTLRFDLYQDPADENAFFVYEAYRDKKAFEEHKKNLPYQRWESEIRPEVIADFQPLFDGNAVYSVEMEDNIMPNGETLKKITGDIADEAGEATYRVAASLLVNAVEVDGIKRFVANKAIRDFLENNKQIGEAVISFALAAFIELAPTSKLGDARKRLAFNLRVLFYQRFEELVLSKTPLVRWIEDEAERALLSVNIDIDKIEGWLERAKHLVKEEREPRVQPPFDASKTAEAGAGHEKATKAKA